MTIRPSKQVATLGILAAAIGCLGAALLLDRSPDPGPEADPVSRPEPERDPAVVPLAEVASVSCAIERVQTGAQGVTGNPRARAAAQRGLDFLAANTKAWQKQNGCYGCHVQAVSLEGMVVGHAHQYTVSTADTQEILDGMLSLPGGGRGKTGFSYQETQLLQPSRAFGGGALARYDATFPDKIGDDLLAVAEQLLQFQRDDGGYDLQYGHPSPVVGGDLQGTYLAIRTWKQAYERTADARWLTAVQAGERYVQIEARRLIDDASAPAQQLSYALLGLIEAGVGAAEDMPSALRQRLIGLQTADGSWPHSGQAHPLMTGQALYSLRLAGMSDTDEAVARGTAWLIQHQNDDGGWSAGGASRGEAMWAVLGLVSIDVLTVAFHGVHDGQHADGTMALAGSARDNLGPGVVKMDLSIDDIRVASQCGGSMRYDWNTRQMEAGKHVVVLSAENADGKVSHRRIELYTGAVYMTQTGTEHSSVGTVVTLRNIAPKKMANQVRINIYATRPDGSRAAGGPIATMEQTGEQGSMRFVWDGKTGGGGQAAAGKYVASLEMLDADKKVVQTESVSIANLSRDEQKARWGEVGGRLTFEDGDAAENAEVELVDKEGNVVQKARTTQSGQYSFKQLEGGDYRVRLRKDGYVAGEQQVKAAPAAAPAKADLKLEKKRR